MTEAEGGWTRRDWALVAAVLAVALGLKAHYSVATAGELRWILAPTTRLVSAATGAPFAFEAGSGYLSAELGLLIAPVCAGVNFLVVAFCSGVFGLAPLAGTTRRRWAFAAACLGTAYVATVVANALRILLALALRGLESPWGWPDAAQIHRVEGVVVYLSALFGLYLLARATLVRRHRARPA